MLKCVLPRLSECNLKDLNQLFKTLNHVRHAAAPILNDALYQLDKSSSNFPSGEMNLPSHIPQPEEIEEVEQALTLRMNQLT